MEGQVFTGISDFVQEREGEGWVHLVQDLSGHVLSEEGVGRGKTGGVYPNQMTLSYLHSPLLPSWLRMGLVVGIFLVMLKQGCLVVFPFLSEIESDVFL